MENDLTCKGSLALGTGCGECSKCLEERTNIEALRQEYETQDNAHTGYPIYWLVQEQCCIGRIEDGCSACGSSDTETRKYWSRPDDEEQFESRAEAIDSFVDDYKNAKELAVEISKIESYWLGYAWFPVTFCFTKEGAEDYMRREAHNHGRLRMCVEHVPRRNYELRGVMEHVGFKMNDHERSE